jgi:hypothetical protein
MTSVLQPNECQAVDLGNNTILVNARSAFSDCFVQITDWVM